MTRPGASSGPPKRFWSARGSSLVECAPGRLPAGAAGTCGPASRVRPAPLVTAGSGRFPQQSGGIGSDEGALSWLMTCVRLGEFLIHETCSSVEEGWHTRPGRRILCAPTTCDT